MPGWVAGILVLTLSLLLARAMIGNSTLIKNLERITDQRDKLKKKLDQAKIDPLTGSSFTPARHKSRTLLDGWHGFTDDDDDEWVPKHRHTDDDEPKELTE